MKIIENKINCTQSILLQLHSFILDTKLLVGFGKDLIKELETQAIIK